MHALEWEGNVYRISSETTQFLKSSKKKKISGRCRKSSTAANMLNIIPRLPFLQPLNGFALGLLFLTEHWSFLVLFY